MNSADFQLRGGADPRLAVHAGSVLPAWLWSTDGTRILWANPAGAKVFGTADAAAIAAKAFGPADPHRRQVAQLAGRLLPTGATRLERLRGFGAALGTLATCACSRLDFADGGAGILVVAMLNPGELQRINAPERTAPSQREERLLERAAGAPPSPQQPTAAVEASGHHKVEPLPKSPVHAEIEPTHQPDAAAMNRSTPDYEQAATTGEAPAEFSLIDEIADLAAEPAIEHGAADATAADETTTQAEIHDEEPSPFIEAVADEPSQSSQSEPPFALESPPAAEPPPADELPPPLQTIEPRPATLHAPSWRAPHPRRHPLRFMWQMDAEGRFLLGSDEFSRLIGARTAAGFGRLWSEIAEVFGLDPEGRVLQAVATRDTWSGIALELAGGWRRAVARGIVGIADVRSRAQFRRLPRLWRLPRS